MKSIFVNDIRTMSDDGIKGLIKNLEKELDNRKRTQGEELMTKFRALFCEYEKLAKTHFIEINDVEVYSFETIINAMSDELGV